MRYGGIFKLVTKMMLSKLKVKFNIHNSGKRFSPGYLMGRLWCVVNYGEMVVFIFGFF